MKNSQSKRDINATVPFLRKMITVFLILALALCVSFTVLYAMFDIELFKCLLYIYTIQHILWLGGFLYYKNLPIEPLIMMYISYIIAALYPITCIYWNSGNPIVFSWYLLITLGTVVFQIRNVKMWVSVILAIVISIFFLSPLFPHENFTPMFQNRVDILTVISTIVMAAFFAIIYLKKISIDGFMTTETLQAPAENTENLERDKALYDTIIKYLEENKPFKNPGFNTMELAKTLNTNVTYISKAINAGGCDNFSMLLNNFRINYIKSKIDAGALKKYTIEYIYTEAGYKHRSTFYTAFKSITGMTPSDYLSKQNINDN